MAEDRSFAQLVSLACHDLRTPLATVHGFTRTLAGTDLGNPADMYVELMDSASVQLGELLDRLSLVAQVARGTYAPDVEQTDLAETAQTAAARVTEGEVAVTGSGSARVARADLERALYDLARAAVRHGGLAEVSIRIHGASIEIAPVAADVGPILLGENLRDFGAAVAVKAIEALGGSVSAEPERLVVRLDERQAADEAGAPAGS